MHALGTMKSSQDDLRAEALARHAAALLRRDVAGVVDQRQDDIAWERLLHSILREDQRHSHRQVRADGGLGRPGAESEPWANGSNVAKHYAVPHSR